MGCGASAQAEVKTVQDPKDGAKCESTATEVPTSKPVAEAETAPNSTPVVVADEPSRTTAPEPEANGVSADTPVEEAAAPRRDSKKGKRGSGRASVSWGVNQIQSEELGMAKTYSSKMGDKLLASIDAGEI
eukprot:gnl/MRDRNA2_/MRDRNA2_150300_c0_seq1.p2 gnl/MRDRNA2_/MRDRNA2_150300_c0~~gnl/MRDRNA2_/MRDRNA2_150300_c0_seq1.p2  ORF type:complete len:131 (+),score=20.70 gnl/MRDRNA2_/MRDRNA2_150300_c0_seq1:124-516(+)